MASNATLTARTRTPTPESDPAARRTMPVPVATDLCHLRVHLPSGTVHRTAVPLSATADALPPRLAAVLFTPAAGPSSLPPHALAALAQRTLWLLPDGSSLSPTAWAAYTAAALRDRSMPDLPIFAFPPAEYTAGNRSSSSAATSSPRAGTLTPLAMSGHLPPPLAAGSSSPGSVPLRVDTPVAFNPAILFRRDSSSGTSSVTSASAGPSASSLVLGDGQPAVTSPIDVDDAENWDRLRVQERAWATLRRRFDALVDKLPPPDEQAQLEALVAGAREDGDRYARDLDRLAAWPGIRGGGGGGMDVLGETSTAVARFRECIERMHNYTRQRTALLAPHGPSTPPPELPHTRAQLRAAPDLDLPAALDTNTTALASLAASAHRLARAIPAAARLASLVHETASLDLANARATLASLAYRALPAALAWLAERDRRAQFDASVAAVRAALDAAEAEEQARRDEVDKQIAAYLPAQLAAADPPPTPGVLAWAREYVGDAAATAAGVQETDVARAARAVLLAHVDAADAGVADVLARVGDAVAPWMPPLPASPVPRDDAGSEVLEVRRDVVTLGSSIAEQREQALLAESVADDEMSETWIPPPLPPSPLLSPDAPPVGPAAVVATLSDPVPLHDAPLTETITSPAPPPPNPSTSAPVSEPDLDLPLVEAYDELLAAALAELRRHRGAAAHDARLARLASPTPAASESSESLGHGDDDGEEEAAVDPGQEPDV
ncbi:hypothetical protein H9P43_007838 [Blastocladiella emersonii ATCC 22665]|nr:hypothetical protein H9P43_007838 [Blastocladiella emersonii ATCC 22665]